MGQALVYPWLCALALALLRRARESPRMMLPASRSIRASRGKVAATLQLGRVAAVNAGDEGIGEDIGRGLPGAAHHEIGDRLIQRLSPMVSATAR